MRRLRIAMLGMAVAACQPPSTTTTPAATQPVDGRGLVGVSWITPAQPWRTGTKALALAVVGNVAIVSGADGWLGAMDLRTGTVIRERWLEGDIHYLVRLHDGRLLAMGRHDDEALALAITVDTLAATPVALPDRSMRWVGVQPAVLADGTVVFSGSELPLETYDPITWLKRRTLDARVGWTHPVVRGGQLTVARFTAEADELIRFDLAHGTHTSLGPARYAAVGGRALARSIVDVHDGVDVSRVDVEIDGVVQRSIPGIDLGVAIDDAGTAMLVQTDWDKLGIYALPSGELVHAVELGQAGAVVRDTYIDAVRAVVIADSVVRVIDLATGAITPRGAPPYDRPTALTVDNTGEVGFFGSGVWRIAHGATQTGVTLDFQLRLDPPRGETHTYAVADDDSVQVKSLDDGRTLARYPLGGTWTYPGWFDGTDIVVGNGDRVRSQLMRSRGDTLAPVVDVPHEAQINDVDVAGERALISQHGRAQVVSLATGARIATVHTPNCPDTSWVSGEKHAALEHGGSRIATSDTHVVAIWDNSTHRATTRFDDDIIDHVAFVPHSDDVVVLLQRHLALWSPARGDVRSIGVASIADVAVSPDGTRLAVAFADGRVAVMDIAALRAALTVERAPFAAAPTPCVL